MSSAANARHAPSVAAAKGHDLGASAKPAPPARIVISAVALVEPAAGPTKFAKTEFAVTLATASSKPYEPNPSLGGLDLYALFTPPASTIARRINGFYDGSTWRIRFAPDRVGAWSYTITARDSSGTATTAANTFSVSDSTSRGFVRIDGKCLSLGGAPFFGVGHNTGWQYEVRTPGFDVMTANGENLLAFWMAVPWARPGAGSETWQAERAPLENADTGVGNYQQEAARYLDAVVVDAQANGVYLQPSLWSHGQLRSSTGHRWGPGWYDTNNAYATALGVSASDFFRTSGSAKGSTSAQWRYQQNYLRYVLARWGYSTAITGWVTVVELEGTTGWIVNQTQATAWCTKVADYFRANDQYRVSGLKYPIATSRSNAPAWTGAGDQRATDSYRMQHDDIGIAEAIASDTTTMRLSGKPSMHTEFGGDTTAIGARATQPTHLHNGLWAGVATGACVSPLVWTDGGAFPLLTDPTAGAAMTQQLRRYAEVVGQWPEVADPAAVAATLTAPAQSRAWGMIVPVANAQRGFAWTQATSGVFGAQIVLVHGLTANASYRCDWYDTWTVGSAPLTDYSSADASGTLTLTAPAVTRADIAVHFARQDPPVALASRR
ncbi:MAG: DUF5060 domain-containing protein [Planctomycetes bacterium]|nr:DUF5060 domain-containing protein [Planctomycetota bacterium]